MFLEPHNMKRTLCRELSVLMVLCLLFGSANLSVFAQTAPKTEETVVTKEAVDTGIISGVYAQLSKDKTKIRFVAAIESVYYRYAGFKVTITYDGRTRTIPNSKMSTQRVAKSIFADGKEIYAKDIDSRCKYIFTAVLDDLPLDEMHKTDIMVFEVTAYKRISGSDAFFSSDTKIFKLDSKGKLTVG